MKKILLTTVVIAVLMFTCQTASGMTGNCKIDDLLNQRFGSAGINIQFGRIPLVPSRIHVKVPGFEGHFGFPRPYYNYRAPIIPRYYRPLPRYRSYYYMGPYGSGTYMIMPLG